MIIVFFFLLLAGESMQDPHFTPNVALFKGIPELPEINKELGERRIVYFHEQIVAIVDVNANKKLFNCELVEVYEPEQADLVLKNLTQLYKAYKISFSDATRLMEKCDKLDENLVRSSNAASSNGSGENPLGNPLLIGIVPGTKWCGTGDIAKNYRDLGSRAGVDRCCRAHDLCPVKVRAYRTRYNIYNDSFFSKSHCNCDQIFYSCLKGVNHISANIIGNIYFNIAQPDCVGDDPNSNGETKVFRTIRRQF